MGLQEIALAMATALKCTAVPEPLPVDLPYQSAEDVAFLVKHIIDECADAAIPLQRITVDPEMLAAMPDSGMSKPRCYHGVLIESDDELICRIELYRGAPQQPS
jgi:hypothetical protein